MLVLTRRVNESIIIGDNIEIKIVMVRGGGEQAVIRLGINAPKQVTVLRKEVYDEVVAANQQAAQVTPSIPAELLAAAVMPSPSPQPKPKTTAKSKTKRGAGE